MNSRRDSFRNDKCGVVLISVHTSFFSPVYTFSLPKNGDAVFIHKVINNTFDFELRIRISSLKTCHVENNFTVT